ncbi:hypothetical protein DY000_02012987 [Brassica cretica]|uniref:Uncharacterized protein n=1 Tax=Brassica cretica TaxID=69181 RepID=A0ABQ7D599_BRACR|nr:hypothetical protein DY000_02012987 [Brassica cretica]
MREMRLKYPDATEEQLEQLKQNNFATWLSDIVSHCLAIGHPPKDWLREIVCGLKSVVKSYPRYCTRGYAFRVLKENTARRTIDCGVSSVIRRRCVLRVRGGKGIFVHNLGATSLQTRALQLMKENSGVPVDDFTLMKTAYTNKKTGEIQDGLIKGVIQVVENRKENLLAAQASMCEEGDSASSNSLTVEQLNNLVLEAVPRKKGRYVGLARPTGEASSSSSAHIHVLMSLWSRLRPRIRRLSS